MKIYLACGLTHVPRSHFEIYAGNIHAIANSLIEHEVKYALVNSDPQLSEIDAAEKAKYCYEWDRKMVEEANLIIAEASYPSIGLGIELQIAEFKNIPIIMVYSNADFLKASPISYLNPDSVVKHDLQIGRGHVSLMALGLPNVLRVIPYETIIECISEIRLEIEMRF